MRGRARGAIAAAACLAACGCTRDHGTGEGHDSGVVVTVVTADAREDASPARVLALRDAAAAPRARAPCRALVVRGAPRRLAPEGDAGPRAIAVGDQVPAWIVLDAAGDEVTAKLPETGREVTVFGPGRAKPCAEEGEAWVVRGGFQGGRGGGETPGGEEWVVTPFAVVRYGAAVLEVTVDATSAKVTLRGGAAALLGEGTDAWKPADPSAPSVARGAPLGAAGTRAADERCERTRAAAKGLEDALLEPGATRSPTFAATAMQATDARILARAACAVAALRAEVARPERDAPR